MFRGSPRSSVLKTGRKLSTATLPLLRVELGVLYFDSTDGATKPTYALCHVRCALSLRIAELLVSPFTARISMKLYSPCEWALLERFSGSEVV